MRRHSMGQYLKAWIGVGRCCGPMCHTLGDINKSIKRCLVELDRADEVFEQTGTRSRPGSRMERTLQKLEHLQKEAARDRLFQNA